VAIIADPAPRQTVSPLNPVFDIPELRSVLTIGALDESVPFSYFLNVPSELWQELASGIKIGICLLSFGMTRLGRFSAFCLYGLAAIVLISYGAGGAGLDQYMKVFGFLANLLVTLFFIRRSNLPAHHGG
jgi:hypothetical protein